MRREQNYSGVASEPRIFYGWWIVAAAFVNLFFATGILFYGFPVFYPALVSSLGFTRAQVTQGFLLGFIFLGTIWHLYWLADRPYWRTVGDLAWRRLDRDFPHPNGKHRKAMAV